MKKSPLVALVLVSLALVGCSATGGDFNCKATALDSCLTIEQVDAMTRYADGAEPRPRVRKNYPPSRKASNASFSKEPLVKQASGQPVWLAPKLLKQKSANTLYAGGLHSQTKA